jgi:hypothetical protein
MSNLNQVVNLHPSSDDRLSQGCPVNGRIGPDLDIVLDFHTSHLGIFTFFFPSFTYPNPSLPKTTPP